MLAELEGVPTGQARNTLEVGQRLTAMPGNEERSADRRRSLGPKWPSCPEPRSIPAGEAALLRARPSSPSRSSRRGASGPGPHRPGTTRPLQVRRIHAARHFISWTDTRGPSASRAATTPIAVPAFIQQMDFTSGRLKKAELEGSPMRIPSDHRTEPAGRRGFLLDDRKRSESIPTDQARSVSTVPNLDDVDPGPPPSRSPISSTYGEPTGRGPRAAAATESARSTGSTGIWYVAGRHVIERPPSCSMMVRVDLDALLRGPAIPGEICEIDNQGPIPVAMARDMANDSFLRFVFHQAGDIRAISHFGRTINRQLRTALAYRDRCCVVPGCGVSYGLEIDHIRRSPRADLPSWQNLALLCLHHHHLKSNEGWRLERLGTRDDDPRWSFTPMPPFGEEPEPLSG